MVSPLAEILIAEAQRLYELDVLADNTWEGSRARACIINALASEDWLPSRIARRLGVDRGTVHKARQQNARLAETDAHYRAVSARLQRMAREWHERMERDD